MSNPTLLVEQFNGALGAFAGVDPIRYDDGLWLEEAATNYVANPVGGVDNGNWSTVGTIACTRTTSLPGPLPSWAAAITTGFHVTASGSTSGVLLAGATFTLPAAGTYSVVGFVWIPSANFTATGLTVYGDNYSGSSQVGAVVDLGLHDQWQMIAGSVAPVGGDLNGSWNVYASAGALESGDEFWFTCAAIQNEAVATSPVVGSMGTGYAFTGTAHASTSTRAASSASVATTGHIAPASGSLAFRNTRKIDTGAEEIILTVGTVGAATDAMRIGYDATDHPFMEWNSNNAGWQRVTATATVAADVEALLYFDWSGTTIRCSVDNSALDSDTRDAVEDDWGAGALALVA